MRTLGRLSVLCITALDWLPKPLWDGHSKIGQAFAPPLLFRMHRYPSKCVVSVVLTVMSCWSVTFTFFSSFKPLSIEGWWSMLLRWCLWDESGRVSLLFSFKSVNYHSSRKHTCVLTHTHKSHRNAKRAGHLLRYRHPKPDHHKEKLKQISKFKPRIKGINKFGSCLSLIQTSIRQKLGPIHIIRDAFRSFKIEKQQ